MLKKIILPVVILIFTQQDFYGMKKPDTNTKNTSPENKGWEWKSINKYVNKDTSEDKKGTYPKLWLLWAFLDNVPFQYGDSKIWKHGEAYCGLSNGIGFFPSFLNFGWLKIGIIDAHINVINLISDYFKNFIQRKTENKDEILIFLLFPVVIHSFFNFHIFSVKILNCIKIKLVAPLTFLFVSDESSTDLIGEKEGTKKGTAWYITYNEDNQISWWYALLSPRIEINISGIIKYFRGQ